MASVNKVILVGNIGADPESRYMPNGDAVANARLATTESWKDKASGEKREITEWHRLVFYRKMAELVTSYVKKGSQLYVEGRIRTRKWQDKEGQERYTTEIEVTEMQFLGNRLNDQSDGDSARSGPSSAPRSSSGGGGGNGNTPPARKPSFDPLDDDDLPFATVSMAYDKAFFKATSRVRRVV